VDFVIVVGLFALFVLGLVFAIQGFVRKEIYPEGQPFAGLADFDRPGVVHAPERHPVRLFLLGVGLMVVAVALGLLLL
jgi:hypothetical protein